METSSTATGHGPGHTLGRTGFRAGLAGLLLLGLAAAAGLAQENADCLTCHGDKGLTAERGAAPSGCTRTRPSWQIGRAHV